MLDVTNLLLPDSGLFVVASKASGESYMRQIFTYDAAQFLRTLREQDRNSALTVYYATAAFTSEAGGHTANNVLAKKVLHIDIDIGEGDSGHVTTQSAALDAISRLTSAADIPYPSVIVSSGYGLHVYWSMRVPFMASDIAEWIRLSKGLVEAARQHTPEITKDISKWASRSALLRFPGTMNKKHMDWQPVEVIGGTGREYARYEFDNLLTTALVQTTPVRDKIDMPLVDANDLVSHCAVIGKLAKLNGDIPYPAWYNLIKYSYHTKQGVAWAHKVSKGPKYSPDKIDEIFSTYAGQFERGEFRPPTCATFCASAGLRSEQVCGACPLFGKNKSPLLVAPTMTKVQNTSDIESLVHMAAVSYDVPDWLVNPDNRMAVKYSLTASGALYRTPAAQNENDTAGVLFSNAWWCADTTDENNTTYYNVARAGSAALVRFDDGIERLMPTEVKRFRVKSEIFADKSSFARGLASVGIHIESQDRRGQAFSYGSFTRSIAPKAGNAATSFGWQSDGRFIIGPGAMLPDGRIQPYVYAGVPVEDKNAKQMATMMSIGKDATKVGAYVALRDFAAMANVHGKALMLAALSTPLFASFGINGYMFLVVGESGVGKTALQELISSVYSGPNAYMIAVADSAKSWPKTLSTYNSIPVTFDEFGAAGQSDERHKDDFIINLTQGRTKKVMSADQRQLGGTDSWATAVFASSNDDYVSALCVRDNSDKRNAILARLSQIHMSGPVMDRISWTRVTKVFKDNHGLIGALVLASIMPRIGEITSTAQAEIAALMNGVSKEYRIKMMVLSAMLTMQRILSADDIVDMNLTAKEITEALELNRLYPQKATVVDKRAEQYADFLDMLVMAVQDRTLYYRDVSGAHVPVMTIAPPRTVCATAVIGAGSTKYCVAKAALTSDKRIMERPMSAAIIASLPTVRKQIVEGAGVVACVEFTKAH